ncbi:hypothetical protein [Azospirillum sp. sgz302134]
MRFLRIEAVVRTDRNAALMAVSDAISGSGGWIVDHSLFSDVMAVITFAVPADRTGDLGRALDAAGIPVTPAPPDSMGGAEGEVSGQLTLTFANGTGDLRRTVPAFQ